MPLDWLKSLLSRKRHKDRPGIATASPGMCRLTPNPAPQTIQSPIDRSSLLDFLLTQVDSLRQRRIRPSRIRPTPELLEIRTLLSATPIKELTGPSSDRFPPIQIGTYGGASFEDLDADGDLDLVAGTFEETPLYFKNIGTPSVPSFVQQFGTDNPFNGVTTAYGARPELGDLDNDGDFDLILGNQYGEFQYLKNIGSATHPQFAHVTQYPNNPVANVYFGTSGPFSFATGSLGDLDNDGDLDLVAGFSEGGIRYFQNIGSPTNPWFEYDDSIEQILGYAASPALVDLNADGKLDMISGSEDGIFTTFYNTSSATQVIFNSAFFSENPLVNLSHGRLSVPTTADLDADGDQDLIISNEYGTLGFYENIGGTQNPFFLSPDRSFDPLFGIDLGSEVTPVLASIKNDYFPQLVTGNADGTLQYFHQSRIDTAFWFVQQFGAENPLDGIDVGDNSDPEFGDIDGNWYSDLVVGNANGTLRYFRNVRTYEAGIGVNRFEELTGSQNPFNTIDVGTNSSPMFISLNSSGLLDLVVGNGDGRLSFFRNTGTTSAPVFVEQTGSANPFNGIDVGTNAKPSLEWDAWNRQIVSVGNGNGTIDSYCNVGSWSAPVFEHLVGDSDPFSGIDVGTNSSPLIGDFNSDGILDLLVGRATGDFVYYETATPKVPTLIPRFGEQNPLHDQQAQYRYQIGFADLDQDDDFDYLMFGYHTATYYKNIGTAADPNFVVAGNNSSLFTSGAPTFEQASPGFGDFDGDGDLDLVVRRPFGNSSYFFRNIGTFQNPLFDYEGIIPQSNSGSYYPFSTTSGDLDADGDVDLVVSGGDGEIKYLENNGSTALPFLIEHSFADSPFREITSFYGSRRSTLGDVDGDGDLDLVMENDIGVVSLALNSGTPSRPAFLSRNVAYGIPSFSRMHAGLPDLLDWDRDGDQDLIVYGVDQFTFVESVTADLSLDVVADRTGPLFAGDQVIYTLTLSNSGPDDALQTALSLSIPAGLTGVTISPSSGIYQQGHWIVPSLASGSSVTLTIRGTIASAAVGQSLTLRSEIVATGITDPDSTPNNSDPLEDDQDFITLQVNSAPTLNPNGNPLLNPVTLNIPAANNPGTLVSDIIARMTPNGGITDPDTGALQGIAINGLASTNGTWEFTINNGSTWSPIGTTGNTNARLLAADSNTRIRFIPNTGFLGEAKLAFTAWDQTAGTNGGTANVAARGGSTAFSLAYEYASQHVVNTAPELDADGNPTLDPIPQNVANANNPGTLVASLISRMAPLGSITDPNPGALLGIAINGLVSTNGTWQYTVNNGTNWTNIATTGNTNARLLFADANTRIRFIPNTGFLGEAKLAFVAWDRTTGANGGIANVNNRGGSTPYSLNYEYASVFVINSAPVLTPSNTSTLNSIPMNVPNANNPGTLISDLITRMSPGGITDPNPSALQGIAINGLGGVTNGTWQYTLNNGSTWLAIATTGNSNARLLAANPNTRIRFVPNNNFTGTVKLAFVAWDQTTGLNGTTTNVSTRGNTTPFSLLYDYASLTITP